MLNHPDVLSILKALRAGTQAAFRAVLVQAPTGAGKTVLFCVVAEKVSSWGFRVLILVHRREILDQTIKTLHRLGVSCAPIMPGRTMSMNLVQVGMVQTVKNRMHQIPRPDLIILDEAHHTLQTGAFGHVVNFWNSTPLLGMTATPCRLSGEGLGRSAQGVFDKMILGPSLRWLVAEGWLAFPKLYRPPNVVQVQYHVKKGDYDQAEQAEVMMDKAIVGDVISHYRQHLDGLPTICACVSIEHARVMAEQFVLAGYRAQAVWGDMPRADREATLDGLRTGAVQIVTFCDLISEGVDVPLVMGCILLRRTLSLSLYLQLVGRALRPVYADGFDLESKEGRLAAQAAGMKPHAVILDHVGNYALHGHVLADREWSLEATKRKKGDKPPVTWTCPDCGAVWPGTPKRCPDCGYTEKEAPAREVKPMKQIEGELVEAGVPEDQAEGLAAFVKRTEGMAPGVRAKAMWAKAFELQDQGDNGRQTMEKLAEAVGCKKNWTKICWEAVSKKKEGVASE